MNTMAYSEFTLSQVRKKLGIKMVEPANLFAGVIPIEPSDFLRQALARYTHLAIAIGTEKAKSEFLIAPILAEIRDQFSPRVSLFSGNEFNVAPDLGLQGFCDFILSLSPEQLDVTAPVVTIVEAKNDNLKSGLGQCIAEMVAAQIFNRQEEQAIDIIYGAVTNGTNWRFLRLQNDRVEIDGTEYFILDIHHILGILSLPIKNETIAG
jgi:co-chaperonin GroES (HSP10)